MWFCMRFSLVSAGPLVDRFGDWSNQDRCPKTSEDPNVPDGSRTKNFSQLLEGWFFEILAERGKARKQSPRHGELNLLVLRSPRPGIAIVHFTEVGLYGNSVSNKEQRQLYDHHAASWQHKSTNSYCAITRPPYQKR